MCEQNTGQTAGYIYGVEDVLFQIVALSPHPTISVDGGGDTYWQDFGAAIGSDSNTVGMALPDQWAAISNGILHDTISQPFPPNGAAFGTYNVGEGSDRTLATGSTDSSQENKLRLFAEIAGSLEARAVRLAFDVEAGAGSLNAEDPGEAAFHVTLEADDDGSFSEIVDFTGGSAISTGVTLTPGLLDGNAESNLATFDSGVVPFADPISIGPTLRLVFDAQNAGQTTGYIFGLDDVLFRIIAPGDADGNGEVDSSDLFAILAAGRFNHPELGPATWGMSDFDGDEDVDSGDLFLMLGAAKYNAGPYSSVSILEAVPEPSTFALAAFGLLALVTFARRRALPTPAISVSSGQIRSRFSTSQVRWLRTCSPCLSIAVTAGNAAGIVCRTGGTVRETRLRVERWG